MTRVQYYTTVVCALALVAMATLCRADGLGPSLDSEDDVRSVANSYKVTVLTHFGGDNDVSYLCVSLAGSVTQQ
jgi:hypothetical protein